MHCNDALPKGPFHAMQAITMHAHKHAFVIFYVHCFDVFSFDAIQCDARQVNTAHKMQWNRGLVEGNLFLNFLCVCTFSCVLMQYNALLLA